MKPLFLDEIARWIGGKVEGEGPLPCKVVGISTDTRTIREGELFFAISGENFDGHNFVRRAFEKKSAGAVISRLPAEDKLKEFSDRLILVDDTIKALGELAKYYRNELPATIIAVTGSNGKTTTKELVYHILSKKFRGKKSIKSFNNKIGVPLSIFQGDVDDEFLVLELGTNRRGEIEYLAEIVKPDIGIITQVAEVHIEGLGDIRQISAEKASLAKYVEPGGAIVVNGDNPILVKLIDNPRISVFTFGRDKGNDLILSDVREYKNGVKFVVNNRFEFYLPVMGVHNAYNCLAAIVVARRMGFLMEEIAEIIKDFRLPPMRLEVINIDRMTVINDAYNANPVSMESAIRVLENFTTKGRKILCCGDMLELGPKSESYHRKLGRRIGSSGKIDVLIAVGEFADYVVLEAISAGIDKKAVFKFDTSEEAGKFLKGFAKENDTILLKGSRKIQLEKVLDYLKEDVEVKGKK